MAAFCDSAPMNPHDMYAGNVIYESDVIYGLAYPRTAWRAAPSRDPGSSAKIAA
jgi:hypothetical protein